MLFRRRVVLDSVAVAVVPHGRRRFPMMKRISVFVVFGLITGLHLVLWPVDDVSTAATAAVATCDPETVVRCNTAMDRDDYNCCPVTVPDENRADVEPGRNRPRTGLKTVRKTILYVATIFYEHLELMLYMSLYKIKLIYTTLFEPVLWSWLVFLKSF